MNRREFMTWVGVGSIAASLPVALAACSPKKAEAPPASSPQADGFQKIGSLADLDKQGFVTSKIAAGTVLAIRNPAAANQVIAVNPTCPHRGCVVDWKQDQKEFVCPCHKAKFASDGAVRQGPADKPLATYAAKVEGDSILVKS